MHFKPNQHNKIIFSGTVGAGKSTAIAALSDIVPVSTEAIATDATARMKKTTTVAMDYGLLILPNGEKVMLYGTPGQERFSFMWEILAEGGIGLILLINNSASDPLKQLEKYLGAFKNFIESTAVAIGVTHMDRSSAFTLNDYRQKVASLGYHAMPAIFRVDARRHCDVAMLVKALLYTLNPGLMEA
ncbi:MAG TPA: ATP/GTP-binding protein [Accumulibacter sp.]|nr:ATP/GTP-binding protein [Accumulibacter sp.]HMX21869.1 ATP/GTP-binding protein [Accumulibacter sp.]HMY07624.1 ATP/GTP-binding protein [Accumulibacter sp.]HNE13707.1 ATP/GTP-binding protein [Accumulibacter sp.]HNG38777.1 ATP/GTP-binding protein [Accumulibacter sp.]